ncbi:MAG TPA: hypothetical protein VEC11_08190 [Allosphingosinicella sp.]|nr:hypothetical protein [Allosphingosinicella sp.]
MIDVMAALKDRRAKAEAKVLRASKALDSAKKELEDVAAAERVMADITGESVEVKAASGATSERDKDIAKLLGLTLEDAKTPAELYPLYVEEHGGALNLDAFRTALWRLQKRVIQGSEKSWTVKSQNGRYWRMPAYASADIDELLGGDPDDS